MAYKHNSTLCWECEWAAGKDEKCPWAREFKPVPGWKTIPTKIISYSEYRLANGKRIRKRNLLDSFVVQECPMFELAEAIKKGIINRNNRKGV